MVTRSQTRLLAIPYGGPAQMVRCFHFAVHPMTVISAGCREGCLRGASLVVEHRGSEGVGFSQAIDVLVFTMHAGENID